MKMLSVRVRWVGDKCLIKVPPQGLFQTLLTDNGYCLFQQGFDFTSKFQ